MAISQFYLTGHSFGGYVVGNYAVKYHQYIKKLLLLSPIGVRELTPEEIKAGSADWENRFKGRKGPPKWARMIAKAGWGKKVSPFGLARFAGKKTALKYISRYVENRQKVETDNQREAVTNYMYQIFMRPGTTEYALMILFNLGLLAHLPLGTKEKLLSPDFPIAVSFIYGENDWVRNGVD